MRKEEKKQFWNFNQGQDEKLNGHLLWLCTMVFRMTSWQRGCGFNTISCLSSISRLDCLFGANKVKLDELCREKSVEKQV